MESFQNKCQNGKTDIKQILSQATGDQKNSLVLLAQVSYQNQIFQQGVLRPSWLHVPMDHRPNLSERLRFIIFLPPPPSNRIHLSNWRPHYIHYAILFNELKLTHFSRLYRYSPSIHSFSLFQKYYLDLGKQQLYPDLAVSFYT